MPTISNTPRPGYVYDSTDAVWYPIGTGTHSHNEIASTIVDAKGDIIAATAADAVSRLAVGANGTVLTAASGQATGLEWATPSSGGMTLISTTSLTGSSVTLSSIPQSYNNLQLVIVDFKPATGDRLIIMQFNGVSSAVYNYNLPFNGTNNSSFGETGMYITGGASNSVATNMTILDIPNYTNSTSWQVGKILSITVNNTTTTNFNFLESNYMYGQTTAISSITLAPSGTTFTSGTALLYGVK